MASKNRPPSPWQPNPPQAFRTWPGYPTTITINHNQSQSITPQLKERTQTSFFKRKEQRAINLARSVKVGRIVYTE